MRETEWNEAIGAWFFKPEMSGRPVFLSLDEETIEAIAKGQRWGLTDPVQDFEDAIRLHIPPTSDAPFKPWQALTKLWQQRAASERSTFPPCLAIMGATVLAATRMGAVERTAGLPPFYKPLRRIIGLRPFDGGMPPGFAEHVPFLWTALRKWLDEDNDGALGLATADAPPHYWPYIGYSVSQALLRGYDRARLTDFFIAIGAERGTDLDPDELLLRLREWGALGGRMSDRLSKLLASSDMSEYLGRVLARELATWDGTRRDETGRRVLRVLLTIDAKRGEVGFAAPIPPGFPVTEVNLDGEAIRLDPTEEYVEIPVDITDEILRNGWSHSYPTVRLEYRARAVVPLLPDDRMSRWSSRERVEAGRPHYVVADNSLRETLGFFLKARSPLAVPARRVKLPPTWFAYKEVVIEPGFVEVPAALAVLLPRAEVLPSLEGGLRLDSRRPLYLSGGPPDIDVPGVKGLSLSVELDGDVISEVDPRGCVLALTGSQIQAGHHEVKIGSVIRHFEILDHVRERPTDAIFAHHVTEHEMGWCADGPARAIDPSRGVAISGCRIELLNTDHEWRDPPPVMIKVSPEIMALGPNHEVAPLELHQPEWAEDLGLPFNAVEINPLIRMLDFEPLWLLRMFARHYEVVDYGYVTHFTVAGGSDSQPWLDLEHRLVEMRAVLTNLAPLKIDAWKVYRNGEI